jgi:hypothetical protein
MTRLLEILPPQVTRDPDQFIFARNQDGFKAFPKALVPYLEMFAEKLNIHDFGVLGELEIKGL